MFKKILDYFDIRTDNKWFNVLLSGLVSFIIAYSSTKLFYEEPNNGFTAIVFLILWVPLIYNELRNKEKAAARQKAKEDKKAKKKKK